MNNFLAPPEGTGLPIKDCADTPDLSVKECQAERNVCDSKSNL